MSGFSKRLLPVYAETKRKGMAPWTIHDLRRTVRTGLGGLKVLPHVAELVLNHALTGELARIYDRGDYWAERVDAAERWAAHVREMVEAKGGSISPMFQQGS